MDRRAIVVPGLPKAGPYSHAVEAGGLVFLAGMIPIDESGVVVKDDVRRGTALALDNVRKVLEAAGLGLDRVIKTTVFLRDMSDFAAMNEVYATYFTANEPARSTVEVKDLPAGAPVEIEVVAAR